MSWVPETKVTAASLAAAAAGLVVWLLGEYVFVGDTVPPAVELFVWVAVTGLVTFAAGWLARHTPRPAADAGTDTAAPPKPG